jgi:ankyrin repeat protein
MTIVCRDEMEQTPLHFAAEGGLVAETRLLCAYGADSNAETNEGPLMAHRSLLGGTILTYAPLLQGSGSTTSLLRRMAPTVPWW